ncbi:MAG: hypothetical protein ABW221_24270 [Vicinamibacteria bacterium]
MNSFFSSILDTVRVWLGLDHDRPYPSHGWLLREPALVRVRAVSTPPTRGNRR